MIRTAIIAAALVCGIPSVGKAAPVSPISYDMFNGNTVTYINHDDIYNGNGNPNVDGNASTGAGYLSGGLGKLTDGVIATLDWLQAGQAGGPYPYVGWRTPNVPDPTIVFNFANTESFNSVTLHLADSDGFGVVDQPESVAINNVLFPIADPVTNGIPFAFTAAFNAPLVTDTLTVQLFHTGLGASPPSEWIMLSEVTFDAVAQATPVPLPAGIPLLLSAFGVVVAGKWFSRKRRAIEKPIL